MVETRATPPRELPSVRMSTQRAKMFYGRCKAEPYNDHSERVLTLAQKVGIVEGPIILDPKEDSERRLLNHLLAELCLYHTVSALTMDRACAPLPPALRDDEVLRELEILNQLKTLDQTGAVSTAYANLLNGGGRPPAALLVQLVDYAVTHDTEDMLNGLVDPQQASMFRAYTSRAQAYNFMCNEARAGEKIYAPMAELFGYPELAGKIMGHAYRVNHPEIHAHVTSVMADEVFQTRLALTQRMVGGMVGRLKSEYRKKGFDVDITPRPVKSEGKIMRKVYRILKSDYTDTETYGKLVAPFNRELYKAGSEKEEKQIRKRADKVIAQALGEYIRSAVKSFDFNRLNDWVAARVVAKKHDGQPIEVEPGEDVPSFILADQVLDDQVRMQQVAINGLVHSREIHRGIYNAHHYDLTARVPDPFSSFAERPLNFEFQLKTEKWHEVAEHGQAAHYYYLGGDRELIDQVHKRYHDIIHGRNGNGIRV